MRRYSLSYFIAQSFKGLWRNGVMSMASITVLMSCLIVMGCFSLLIVNIDYNLDNIGDLNEIVAFVDTDNAYAEGETATLSKALSASSGDVSFLGWSTDPNASEPLYKAGDEYTVSAADSKTGEITMYAVWSSKKAVSEYHIEYSTSGLNIDGALPEDENVYSGAQAATLASGLTARYSSVKFLGWSLTPNATKATYAPGDSYTVDPSDAAGGIIKFYAVWSEMPVYSAYSMVYNTNGVEIGSETPTDESVVLERVENNIRSLENVSEVTLITNEQALAEEMERLSDYQGIFETMGEGENPYPNSFVITYENNEDVSTLEYNLQHIDGIYKVNCRSDIAQNIASLKNGIILIFLWFMAILFVVSVFVIINTVKLAVFSRRQEISIMRYVGATKWFITLPFIIEGIIIGLISSGLGYLLQWYMYSYVEKIVISDYKMLTVIGFSALQNYVLAGFLLIGIFTGVLGSCISLRKYLKK